MKCSIAMFMDKRSTLNPKPKNYSDFEILWKGSKWRQASQLCNDNNYQSMDPTVNLKRECFPGSGSKSGSSTCRCVRVRFILPGTRYPVYTAAVVVLRFISYTRVMLMTNDRPTARPTTSASAVDASSLVPATRSSSQLSSSVKSTFCKANFGRLVTKLFPKDGTIFASQFHVCCSPYPGEREREREREGPDWLLINCCVHFVALLFLWFSFEEALGL
jgi:hypothetical protein